MLETQIVRTDEGGINARILAREMKADFRRVESASVKMHTNLKSAEGKRLFVRYFNSMQLVVHFISVLARTKLKPEDIVRVEDLINQRLDVVDEDLNRAIDSLELLFKHNGITRYATYDTQPLVIEVGIISAIGRRFFEMMHKFDETMPLFQTLDIFGVISSNEADLQRFALKRSVRRLVRNARSLAGGLQKRMNELASTGGVPVSSNHLREEVAPAPMVGEIVQPDVVAGADLVAMPLSDQTTESERPVSNEEDRIHAAADEETLK
jgi:hypothetical protein